MAPVLLGAGLALALVVIAAAWWLHERPDPTPTPTPISEAGSPSPPPSWPRFEDRSAGSGLDAPTESGSPERFAIPEMNGQGIALIDYDGDGLLDLFLVNGSTIEGERMGLHPGDRLYRNLGGGRFQEVTAQAGVAGNSWSMGATAADYDGDGWVDLYVTNVGPNTLWRNQGDGTFKDATPAAGVAGRQFSSASAWGDVDGDGDLDLYVSNFVVFDPYDFPTTGPSGEPCEERGIRVGCGPEVYTPEYDALYLNQGDGTFREASYEAGLNSADPGYGFGIVLADLDVDGDLDAFVANDVSTPNHLWINDGTGRFKEEGVARGVALAGDGKNQACMGVAVFDLGGDGLPDLAITNYWDEYNTLYENLGGGRFQDVSAAAGWVEPSLRAIGWGLGMLDFDHDGWLDCLAVNGHVYMQLDDQEPHRQPVLLLAGRSGGRFEPVGPADGGQVLERAYPGRGAAFGDLDNDGDVDVVIVRLNEPPALWLNRSGDGRPALSVRLEGGAPNTQGLGARVMVQAGGRTWWAWAAPHTSFNSSNDPRLHFGLGGAARVDRLAVHWPDGTVEEALDLAPGQVVFRRGAGVVSPNPHGKAQSPSRPPATYRNIAQEAGLLAVVRSGRVPTAKEWLLETMGGGVALLDYDGDGDLDVFLADGCTVEDLGFGTAPLDHLYRNEGDGRFRDVAAEAGLGSRDWSMGVAVADYDNDGDQDIYVTNYGPNVLYRNEGDGRFTDQSGPAGVADPLWSVGAVFFDADNDGDLDLYVANYFLFDPARPEPNISSGPCQLGGFPVFCGPNGYTPLPDSYYRNLGDGRFEDATGAAGFAEGPARYGLGVLALDLEHDGDMDLYVANDTQAKSLHVNDGTGRFREQGAALGLALDASGKPGAGMGVNAGDLDGDGWPEIIVTHFSEERDYLFLREHGRYLEVGQARGLGAPSLPYLGWGVVFPDVDRDGRPDVFVAHGHVYPNATSIPQEQPYEQQNVLFLTRADGSLEDATRRAGLDRGLAASSRGVSMGDLDNDGDSDLLVGALDSPPELLVCDSLPGPWLGVRLEGVRSNRDAVGARVTLRLDRRSLYRERLGGGSFASGQDPRLLFHWLEGEEPAALEVVWPSGLVEVYQGLEPGRYHLLREGSGR